MDVVIGIDLGTQGARVFAVQPDGTVAAKASEAIQSVAPDLPPGWSEQDPAEWWRCVRACLKSVTAGLPAGTRVSGLSVDSTSGTVLAVDARGQALGPAILYNDQRSEVQSRQAQSAGADLQKKLGYTFGPSFGLPKMLWLRQSSPQMFEQTRWFLHAADFINGCLTGEWGKSDTSNALKSGYDLADMTWPDFIEHDLGIPLERLPEVVLPGQVIGTVSRQAAEQTGLSVGVPVFAGVTDGTAAQFASGAARPGEWNSTLGTTLVLKGIASELRPDPTGVVYAHRHPEGWWLPGGASNTGTDWVAHDWPGAQIPELDRQAESWLPSGLVRYPLVKLGERFPFLHARAQGFTLGRAQSEVESYAAGIEGMGLVERLAYTMLARLGYETGGRVYITGGGARSALWTRVRASVLGKTLAQAAVPETAFGTAVLAASGCWYPSLSQATREMVRLDGMVDPEPAWQRVYDDRFESFIEGLRERGYITGD